MIAVEVAQLLAAVKILDQRMIEPDEDGFVLRLWGSALERIPFGVAQDAVGQWYQSERYRETRETITPADIVGWWRDRRRHEAEDRPRVSFDPVRIRSGIDEVVAALAERRAVRAGVDPEEAMDEAGSRAAERRLVQSVVCPWAPCSAVVGAPCVDRRGRSLRQAVAHGSRVELALGASGISPS